MAILLFLILMAVMFIGLMLDSQLDVLNDNLKAISNNLQVISKNLKEK